MKTARKHDGNSGLVRHRLPPKRLLPKVDIEVELARHNVSIAQFFILGGLIKATVDERQELLRLLTPALFSARSFERYLFERIEVYLEQHLARRISAAWVLAQIEPFYKDVWGAIPTRRELHGDLISCGQIMDLSPSYDQILRAVELRRMVHGMTAC